MIYFDKEILNGLDEIPTPNSPGTMIVTANAQSIYSGDDAGDTILAGCKYGAGKIFVAAHDCYLNWFHDKQPTYKKIFMDRVRKWLAGSENIEESEIINLNECIENDGVFENYKIIKWHHDHEIDHETQIELLAYVENGGSLFCGSTPWGYLQIYSERKLDDMCLYSFLKNYTGIIYTEECLSLPDKMKVSKNQAKYSQLDIALERVKIKPQSINKYLNTIQKGLDRISYKQIMELKSLVINGCEKRELNVLPSEIKPVCDKDALNSVKLLGKCFDFCEGVKAPGIKEFPGDFIKEPNLLENVTLKLECKFRETLSTGYYLPAGIILIVKVLSDNMNGWSIRIGAHTDNLENCNKLTRWPCIITKKALSRQFNISSAFGGLIYFETPGAGSLVVTMTNLVESPFIDLKNYVLVKDWPRRRNAPGLWAELAGEHIIFTTPSECIRSIENPVEILKYWDKVVKTHHQCRGTNPEDSKRERVVNDKQPSCGYMHSGYPIVTHLDCCRPNADECIFSLEKLKLNGNWGLFVREHELGHNMQRNEWTFDGSVEVTVNLFSMHACEFVVGNRIIKQKWLRDQIREFENFFSKQPTYEDWKGNFGMALMTFAQLIKHFGWDSMRTFMKNFELDIQNGTKLPKNNQEKIDQWVIRYSKIVSRNIKPQFEMFGLPVSKKIDEVLSDLTPWFPIEEKDPLKFFS